MKRDKPKDLIPALPIRYDAPLSEAVVVTTVILEAVGHVPTYLWHWPWWIGQQLPIAYLLWKLAEEGQMRLSIIRAWNQRISDSQPKGSLPEQEDIRDVYRRLGIDDDQH